MIQIRADQLSICKKYGAECVPIDPLQKVGIADDVRSGAFPINGLRHLPSGDTSGWYLWAGDDFSSEGDYFKPVHLFHLQEEYPELVKFIGLSPGWRFLVAANHEDAWFDPSLLIE